jgi:hypothetical protein
MKTNDEKKEYQKKYRLANKEKLKQYRIDNCDRIREKRIEYDKKNKEKIKQQHIDYKKTHADEISLYQKQYAALNKDAIKNYPSNASEIRKEVYKSYRINNKDSIRNRKYVKNYGITLDQYNKLFDEQKGCCKICGTHQDELDKKLVVDHCHETNIVRGLLCDKCNRGLGHFNDDVNLLQIAIKYLIHDDDIASE